MGTVMYCWIAQDHKSILWNESVLFIWSSTSEIETKTIIWESKKKIEVENGPFSWLSVGLILNTDYLAFSIIRKKLSTTQFQVCELHNLILNSIQNNDQLETLRSQ